MRIIMVGTGYVGLVSGACFADFGHDVVCVDKDSKKIDALKRGEIPIFEPGLDDIVRKNCLEGRLSFATNLSEAANGADAIFIAVGTPSRRGDGHADRSYVYSAAREIAEIIDGYTVVITKSTVPVGTGDEVAKIIRDARPNAELAVVSNPEFLREGAAINDFKHPDRIIIGTDDARARAVMSEIYRPLYVNQGPLLFTSRRTAELIKYAGNAFLATKISFINEMADLCEALGADVQDVSRGIGLDNRIGSKFLHAGPGYGGSCFPKDTLALIKTAENAGSRARIVETVVEVNELRKRKMADRIIAACDGTVWGKKIAVLGLTFKPNTNDMRDSPSIPICVALLAAGAEVIAYDPAGMPQAAPLMPGVRFAKNAYDCIKDVDAMVLVTEWEVFRALNLKRVKSLMKAPVVVDLRNVYGGSEMTSLGFRYLGIGRGLRLSWGAERSDNRQIRQRALRP